MTCIAQLLQKTKKDPKERRNTHTEREKQKENEDNVSVCVFLCVKYSDLDSIRVDYLYWKNLY